MHTVWFLAKVVIALGAALALYLIGAGVVRNFATSAPPPEPEDFDELADVDYRYGCVVCGAQIVMYAAPADDPPDPPRHCREDMVLITPVE